MTAAASSGGRRSPTGAACKQELEKGIARLCGERIRVTGAGRTDAGVHARGQVASLQTSRELPLKAWTVGLNALLPEDVACVKAEMAPEGFDARRWARGKRYAYTILQTAVRSPLQRGRVWEIRRPLEVEAMRRAAPALLGRTTSPPCAPPTAPRAPPFARSAGWRSSRAGRTSAW